MKWRISSNSGTSGKRGGTAGDFNARYGVDPGFSFYTHVSDQHGPYHVTVISAATHEAPYVLDATELGDLLPMTGTEYVVSP